MKDILEKFGLSEFFAYLCPGAILVCSSALWAAPGLNDLLGSKLEKHPLVVVLLLVVVCYALGLIVTFWGSSGAHRYVRAHRVRRLCSSKLRERLTFWPLRFCCGIPVPVDNEATVEGHLRMSQDLTRYAGLPGLSALETPWDRLSLYRTVMTDRLGKGASAILSEADAIHRRFLFAVGVALALFLVALQSGLLALSSLHGVRPFSVWIAQLGLPHLDQRLALFLLATLGILASILLRRVAGRLWEQELLLTCSLTRIDPEEVVEELVIAKAEQLSGDKFGSALQPVEPGP